MFFEVVAVAAFVVSAASFALVLYHNSARQKYVGQVDEAIRSFRTEFQSGDSAVRSELQSGDSAVRLELQTLDSGLRSAIESKSLRTVIHVSKPS